MSPGQAAIRLPGWMAERARGVLSGAIPPVTPRDAATVMLLRPAAGGLQVYMLRRASSMAFAPGAYVFPGGSVDPSDAEPDISWAGPGPDVWAQVLEVPDELARALVCAAVRETFEESGVLLAGPAPGTLVTDTSGEDWQADRAALLAGSLSLARLLRRRDLVLRADLLCPWSRWITPLTEKRRFDTRFFAAVLPSGQRTLSLGDDADGLGGGPGWDAGGGPGRDAGGPTGEADRAAWVDPATALLAAGCQEIMLLPPTAVTLAELRDCGHVEAALATRRSMRPLMPEVSVTGDAVWLKIPAGLEYPL
jgi:8-oxo-dGTP pyrophosphatase MutT (NUDIX family)